MADDDSDDLSVHSLESEHSDPSWIEDLETGADDAASVVKAASMPSLVSITPLITGPENGQEAAEHFGHAAVEDAHSDNENDSDAGLSDGENLAVHLAANTLLKLRASDESSEGWDGSEDSEATFTWRSPDGIVERVSWSKQQMQVSEGLWQPS